MPFMQLPMAAQKERIGNDAIGVIAHAKDKKLVVVTNSNFESRAMYFLFERRWVPKGGMPKWFVVADHGGTDEQPSEETGKRGKKKSTG